MERIDLSGNILDWNIDKQLFFGLEKLTHIYLHNNESLKQNGKLSMHIPDNVQYVSFRFKTVNDSDIVRNVIIFTCLKSLKIIFYLNFFLRYIKWIEKPQALH